MSTTHTDPAAGYRISIVDEDPLRARREARELLAALADAAPQAALDVPGSPASGSETDKGGPVADLIGLMFGGGSFVAAGIQIWLARVPQRTIVVTRPDGASLTISGKQARADDAQIERFLNGQAGPADGGQGGSGAA
ncbi:effector-associated constant component EACC1 [Streptomyces vietnamensis]|uniref:effector-associated constant component EACC1 n=1 Tax=Streptomyces vietnamensis TaxID=362257 RepID=UPI0034218B72